MMTEYCKYVLNPPKDKANVDPKEDGIRQIWDTLRSYDFSTMTKWVFSQITSRQIYDAVRQYKWNDDHHYIAIDANNEAYDIANGKNKPCDDHIMSPGSDTKFLEFIIETGLLDDGAYEQFREFYLHGTLIFRSTKELNEQNKRLTKLEQNLGKRVKTEDRYMVCGVKKLKRVPKNTSLLKWYDDKLYKPLDSLKLPMPKGYTEWEEEQGYISGDEWIKENGIIKPKQKHSKKTTSNSLEGVLPF